MRTLVSLFDTGLLTRLRIDVLDGCVNHAISLIAVVGMSQEEQSQQTPGVAESNREADAGSQGRAFIPDVAAVPEEEVYVDIADRSKKSTFKLPSMGCLVAIGVAFCVVVIFILRLFEPPSLNNEAKEVEALVSANGKEDEKKDEQARALEYLDQIIACIEGYYGAENIEQKLPYVRQVERVKPLMTHYYEDKPVVSGEFDQFVKYRATDLDGVPFVHARVRLKSGVINEVLLEQMSDGSFRLDWESDINYQPMPWKDFIAQRPSETMAMRVLVKRDDFYVFEFRDKLKYDCYHLSVPNSDEYIFGYVDKGSETSIHLRQFFMRARKVAGDKAEPMILLLRFPQEGASKRCVYIDRLMAPRWVYVSEHDFNQ